MGVLGLWQLLAPVGQPVTLESLENKIFAVDISIWLNQAVKGYRDSTGGSVANAHLLSLFSRLCKLLFYKIRPIIVFDGGFPELKKQTIINRQKRRAALKHNSREAGLKLLSNYLASQQLGLGSGSSGSKGSIKSTEKARDEIYKLPPLPEDSQVSELVDDDVERKFSNFSKEDIKYLNQIDLDSEDFQNLPPDVRLEILSTLKESRRHRTWDQHEELPKESNDFSKYQMQALLKKRRLQSKLEQVQSDLRKINSSAYVAQYTSDHVIGETNKIMSDDSSYYVLLKKISGSCVDSKNKSVDGSSVMNDAKNAFIRDIENIDVDDDFKKEEEDLNTAIMNSLSDVKNEKSADFMDDEEYAVDNPSTVDSVNNSLKEVKKSLPVSPMQGKEAGGASGILNQHLDSYVEEAKAFSITDNENELTDYETSKKTISEEERSVSKQTFSHKTVSVESLEEIKFIEAIPKEQAFDSLVVVSSDDEIMSCDDDLVEVESKEAAIEVSDEPALRSPNASNDKQNGAHEILNDQSVSSQKETEKTFVSAAPLDLPSTSSDNHSKPSVSALHRIQEVDVNSESNIIDHQSHLDNATPGESNSDNEQLIEARLELQKELESAASLLQAEKAKQERQARTVQDHMVEECKELLQLFGIPFIVSPLEAEAQCAFFDKVDLTHGTITDDSDVWLFGGKRVYKNFFTQQKFVESFKDKDIFHHFGLSREKLINFALLTGSDYTEGIEGVGPVTAMEIISEFPGDGLDALRKFKDWWEDANKHTRSPENKVRAKLKKLVLLNSFPDENVFDAYLHPEIDSSTEKFTWGRPDLDALRDYTKERFGWSQSKVDEALLPVIKKLNERNSQTHIDSFFSVTLRKEKNLFPSKRIMSALRKITSPEKAAKSKPVKRKSQTAKNNAKKRGSAKTSAKKSEGPNLSESSSESDF